jgi:ABC-type bacteriocin/lantibiotic exporter with double-glycine peptidase domain
MDNSNKGLRIFSRLISLLKLDKKEIVQIYSFALLIGVTNLTLPLGIQSIINFIQSGRISNSWIILVVVVIIASALVGIMQALQLRITENIQQKIFIRASFDFAYRIPKFKMDLLTQKYAPELINRFFDTITVQKGLSKLLIDLSTSSLQIIFALILLSLYHPVFILFSLSLVILLYVIFKFSGKRGLETSLKESKYKYEVVHWLEEVARTMSTFKLAGDTKLHLKKTDELVSGYLKQREGHFKVLIFQYLNLVGFKVFVIAGLLLVGGMLVINQQINLGQFVAAEIIILLIMSNVEKIIMSLETVYDVLTAVEKIGQVTDIELETEEGICKKDFVTSDGFKVEARALSYSYPDSKRMILDELSFTIQKKEKICISGANGSGKSTLLNLISGIYPPHSGTVCINDFSLGNVNLVDMRGMVGDSLDDELLFRGSLFDNIALGREGVGYEEVNWAMEKLGLLDFVKSLPKGYDTEVYPQGKEFSRGKVQQILLARSIAAKPKLLLLEYALEYFDKEAKNEAVKFITSKDVPWTLIAISNDPVVAKECDKIFIMDKGKLVDSGKFDELCNKKEDYKNLYNA